MTVFSVLYVWMAVHEIVLANSRKSELLADLFRGDIANADASHFICIYISTIWFVWRKKEFTSTF